MIVAVLLVALVVVGGYYLAFLAFARRDTGRQVAISDHAMDRDPEGAKALAAEWEREGLPRSPLGRLRLARAWSIAGDHRRALTVLDSVELPGGRVGRPLRRMASQVRFVALEALGEKERAARILDETIEEDPAAPWLLATDPKLVKAPSVKRSLVAQGMDVKEALKEHRFDDAAGMTEVLIRRAGRNPSVRPALPNVYMILGSAQLAAGQDEAADASFRLFVDLSRDRDAAQKRMKLVRAEAVLLGGRISQATAAFEALVDEQGTPEAFAGLAMCRVRQGDADLAARDLDRAIELGYDDQKARFLRAQILVDQGRLTEAVALAREVASSRPSSDLQAVYTLAYVLATAQQPDAEAALRRYVAADPNDPDLAPLLQRPAPDGSTWREFLEAPPSPDL
jgi:tetratricopeptide (TPR) repeat protein